MVLLRDKSHSHSPAMQWGAERGDRRLGARQGVGPSRKGGRRMVQNMMRLRPSIGRSV